VQVRSVMDAYFQHRRPVESHVHRLVMTRSMPWGNWSRSIRMPWPGGLDRISTLITGVAQDGGSGPGVV